MSCDFSLFRKMYNTSAPESELSREDIANNISNSFTASPSYYNVLVNNQYKQGVHIVSSRNGSKNVLSKPNETLNLGDIIHWSNFDWLVMYIDGDNNIQTKGNMLRCNNTLRFRDSNNLEHTYSCVVENKLARYQELEVNRNMFYQTDGVLMIHYPYNEYTKKIREKDRLLLYGEAFEMQVVDRIVNVKNETGAISAILKSVSLTIDEQQAVKYDNAIVIKGWSSVEIGESVVYNAEFYRDGELLDIGELENLVVIWDLISESNIGNLDNNGEFTAVNKGLGQVKVTYQYTQNGQVVEVTGTKDIQVVNGSWW